MYAEPVEFLKGGKWLLIEKQVSVRNHPRRRE
jgi:hypothetical protein